MSGSPSKKESKLPVLKVALEKSQLREEMLCHAKEVVDELMGIIRNSAETTPNRLQGIEKYLEYVLGKPTQETVNKHAHLGMIADATISKDQRDAAIRNFLISGTKPSDGSS